MPANTFCVLSHQYSDRHNQIHSITKEVTSNGKTITICNPEQGIDLYSPLLFTKNAMQSNTWQLGSSLYRATTDVPIANIPLLNSWFSGDINEYYDTISDYRYRAFNTYFSTDSPQDVLLWLILDAKWDNEVSKYKYYPVGITEEPYARLVNYRIPACYVLLGAAKCNATTDTQPTHFDFFSEHCILQYWDGQLIPFDPSLDPNELCIEPKKGGTGNYIGAAKYPVVAQNTSDIIYLTGIKKAIIESYDQYQKRNYLHDADDTSKNTLLISDVPSATEFNDITVAGNTYTTPDEQLHYLDASKLPDTTWLSSDYQLQENSALVMQNNKLYATTITNSSIGLENSRFYAGYFTFVDTNGTNKFYKCNFNYTNALAKSLLETKTGSSSVLNVMRGFMGSTASFGGRWNLLTYGATNTSTPIMQLAFSRQTTSQKLAELWVTQYNTEPTTASAALQNAICLIDTKGVTSLRNIMPIASLSDVGTVTYSNELASKWGYLGDYNLPWAYANIEDARFGNVFLNTHIGLSLDTIGSVYLASTTLVRSALSGSQKSHPTHELKWMHPYKESDAANYKNFNIDLTFEENGQNLNVTQGANTFFSFGLQQGVQIGDNNYFPAAFYWGKSAVTYTYDSSSSKWHIVNHAATLMKLYENHILAIKDTTQNLTIGNTYYADMISGLVEIKSADNQNEITDIRCIAGSTVSLGLALSPNNITILENEAVIEDADERIRYGASFAYRFTTLDVSGNRTRLMAITNQPDYGVVGNTVTHGNILELTVTTNISYEHRLKSFIISGEEDKIISNFSIIPQLSGYLADHSGSTTCTLGDINNQWYNIYCRTINVSAGNDIAECVTGDAELKAGRIIIFDDNGCTHLTHQRLLPGARVLSDTYATLLGQTAEQAAPVAIAGRVLAYPYQDRSKYHAGMAVCSAPDGTIDIMTREEMVQYPDCIIGIVTEIPNYNSWGPNNIPVDGRIWIMVR